MNPSAKTAQARYEELAVHRSPYLRRAQACSRVTVPSLVPPDATSGATDLYKPFQSIGARGVNSLASQLLLTLLPPTRKPFRLTIAADLRQQIPDDQMTAWESALSSAELRVQTHMESMGLRPHVFEAMRHLVVAGNVLIHLRPQDSRVFSIGQYVVFRAPSGEVKEIVIKEMICPGDLDPEFEQTVRRDAQVSPSDRHWELYTRVYLEGSVWQTYQEVKGVRVPDSDGTYAKDKCPYLALRWTRIDGEHYGRSHCDDYFGDILAAESLSRSIIRASAIAAKVVFLVRPNGSTDPSDLQKAEEGDFVDGDPEDISALELQKHHDLGIAAKTLDDVSQRLSYAFLLNSAVRRNGERVTAEEIRYMAAELEDTLGGVYSVLSVEFQLPLIRQVMALMTRAGVFPAMPKDSIVPTIVTGLDALGRNHEGARLDALLGGAMQMFGAELAQYVNVNEYLMRKAASLDINPTNLVKTSEQIAQERQVTSNQSLMEKAAPNAVKAIGDRMNQNQNA